MTETSILEPYVCMVSGGGCAYVWSFRGVLAARSPQAYSANEAQEDGGPTHAV
jgi:hypothetical protein